MVRGISLLRLSGLALAGSVVAGCTATALTAQAAVAGVSVAVLLVAAAALALLAALLVWRRRQTSPSRGEGSGGWSVTADGPAARDAVFSLAPGAAPDAAEPWVDASASEVDGPLPIELDTVDAPPAGVVGHRGADPVLQVAAAPDDTGWLEVPPTSTEDDDQDGEWWSVEEPATRADDLDTPDPAWDEETEPAWDVEPEPVADTGTRSWFDEPDPAWNVDDPAGDDVVDPSSDRR